jgi:sulfoxide reductase heme-binding subunit YedZ
MPRATYWIQRSKRHVTLAAGAIAITGLAYAATPAPDVRHRLSMATAYAGLIFLMGSLWLGPWNVLRQRPNPTSFDLRRDVGIWTGILAIAHTAIGLTVHLRGRMWMYFFKRLHPLSLQDTQFGFWNTEGISKECGKGGMPASWFSMLPILCHFHDLLFARQCWRKR